MPKEKTLFITLTEYKRKPYDYFNIEKHATKFNTYAYKDSASKEQNLTWSDKGHLWKTTTNTILKDGRLKVKQKY